MAAFNFWSESGAAMCLFQAHANNEDWFSTMSALADEVGRSLARGGGPGTDLICADIGAGFCDNLRDVIGLVHYHHGLPTRWHAYEPDADVVDVVRRKTLRPTAEAEALPGLVSITSDLEELFRLQRGRCGAVTLMHSIYYCDDAPSLVARCREGLLTRGGAIVILQLAEDSPFYVLDEFRPRNGTYAIASAFPGATIAERRMRFRIQPETARDPLFQRAVFSLMLRGNRPTSSFVHFSERFEQAFGDGRVVDLHDQIVTIRGG